MNATRIVSSNGFVTDNVNVMDNRPALYQIELCKACLEHITPEMQTKGFSKQISSYGYKHTG